MSSKLGIYVDPEIRQVLSEKYNILDCLEFKQFDLNFNWLENWLQASRQESFGVNDRFVIVHFDCDFYWKGHGLNLNNFIEMWTYYDLPLYTLLLYTNHIGISREVNDICKQYHINDRPTVIETIINPLSYRLDQYNDIPVSVDLIDIHSICLMAGTPRSHRWATFNHLKDLHPRQIAMTLTGAKK